MEKELRTVGIAGMDKTPWGTHFCQFYQTKAGLIDLLVPYFKAGLENHEFCLWVTSDPLDEKDARKAMRQAVSHFDRYVHAGQIEIVPHIEWYLTDGDFDVQRVVQGWIEKLNHALARGYAGMRATGNFARLPKVSWHDFAEYEQLLDRAIEKYKLLLLCTYAMENCGATEVTDVVRIHQHALMERLCMWERVESAELKRTKAELRKLTDHLEALIDKRSIQFNATIEELRNEIATLKRADEELSPRQREVLQLVAKGRSIKEIAGALKSSPKTVEFHKSQIMEQLDLHTTAELTKYAITHGLVSL